MAEIPKSTGLGPNDHPENREKGGSSVAVRFLSAIYMAMAGLLLFGGVAAVLVVVVREPAGVLDYEVFARIFGSESAIGRAAARFFFEAHRLVFFAVIPLSAVTIAAGAALRRRRRWARGALEAVTWIAIAAVLVFGLGWLAAWLTVCLHYMSDTGVGAGVVISVAGGAFLGVLVLFLFLLPLRFLLITLRSPALREELSQG